MSDVKDTHSVLQKSSLPPASKIHPPSSSNSNETSPPPVYSNNPPDVTAAFSTLRLNGTTEQGPSADQCIAHLKLLECLHELRETVATTDGLYGINDAVIPSGLDQSTHASMLTKIREKRWSIYVAQAAKRFELWWEHCVGPIGYYITPRETATMPTLWKEKIDSELSVSNLPPIDVIMVWHAFMLNPRDYLSDCIRRGKQGLWNNGFPLEAVNACIDNTTFTYNTSKEAHNFFQNLTKMPYDALEMPTEIAIKCPKCSRPVSCRWTTCHFGLGYHHESDPAAGFDPGHGSGFAEKTFVERCPHADCQFVINHEQLRVNKFYEDVRRLKDNGTPMPGTILDNKGMYGVSKGSRKHEDFPNRLLRVGGLDAEVLRTLDPQQTSYSLTASVMDIRTVIEGALKHGRTLRRANSSISKQLQRADKITIRRMMACYWDNSSIFSLDLVGAVIRQGSFIEKMHAIDWLHSPSIRSTMNRLIIKYSRFFEIMAKNPLKVAVPTLDVDLAWHTHQLSPQSYYEYATTKTGTFIDHDDKIDETRLSDAFEWTSKAYQKAYNEIYSECTCWYCEAIRESYTNPLERLLASKSQKQDSDLARLYSTPGTDNPTTNPHVSAHNAVRVEGNDESKHTREAKAFALERSYQKACQRAIKKGRQPPSRDEYTKSTYAYGFPVDVPYDAPYMGDPCITSEMYAANPACANIAAGAAGNCCKGTCGGMVAAGGCGGNGAGGACAGSSSGAFGGCGSGAAGSFGGVGNGGGGSAGGGGCGGGG